MVILAGFIILLYPVISDYVNTRNSGNAVYAIRAKFISILICQLGEEGGHQAADGAVELADPASGPLGHDPFYVGPGAREKAAVK